MSNQNEEHNMGSTLWQSQTLDAPRISLAFVRHQAERLNADLRHELFGAYLNVILSFVGLGLTYFRIGYNGPMVWVLRLTMLLAVPGTLYTLFQIRHRNNKLAVAAGAQVVPSLDAYREELRGRQDFYTRAGAWSLLPIIPSVLVLIVGAILFEPNVGKSVGLAASLVVAVLIGSCYYRYKIKKFSRELDALGTLHDK